MLSTCFYAMRLLKTTVGLSEKKVRINLTAYRNIYSNTLIYEHICGGVEQEDNVVLRTNHLLFSRKNNLFPQEIKV